MQNEDQKPEPKSASSGSMKPPRPPCGTVVGSGAGDYDSDRSMKADYGCHVALQELLHRYLDSDIHGAHSALIEQEKLLRDHIGFPSYKLELAMTMARRSDIVLHLGDTQTASSIIAQALQVAREALAGGAGLLTSEFMLKFIRRQDTRDDAK
jgi:hypothetical protein